MSYVWASAHWTIVEDRMEQAGYTATGPQSQSAIHSSPVTGEALTVVLHRNPVNNDAILN